MSFIGILASLEKTVPMGRVAYETPPMVPQNTLEVSPIIGQKDTMFRDFVKTSDLV